MQWAWRHVRRDLQVLLCELWYCLIVFLLRGECKRSPPLPQITQSSFPHLGKSQGQYIRNAMNKPCPGKTTFGITVSPLPGKDVVWLKNNNNNKNYFFLYWWLNFIRLTTFYLGKLKSVIYSQTLSGYFENRHRAVPIQRAMQHRKRGNKRNGHVSNDLLDS